jgi:hypothetical protein
MSQFSSIFEHQTSLAAFFNARELLYECVLDALLFSSSYRPVGKPVSHHVVTQPTFSSLSLFWIIIPAILSAMMLEYHSMSVSLTPSEFFHRHFDLWEACFLQVVTRPLFIRQDCKQVDCKADLFLFSFGPTCMLFELSIALRLRHDLSKGRCAYTLLGGL